MRRKFIISTVLTLMLSVSAIVLADNKQKAKAKETKPDNSIVLQKGIRIPLKGDLKRLGGPICPDILDWNEDGKFDILMGKYYSDGIVYILINKGTNEKPEFEEPKRIHAGGEPIVVDGW